MYIRAHQLGTTTLLGERAGRSHRAGSQPPHFFVAHHLSTKILLGEQASRSHRAGSLPPILYSFGITLKPGNDC